MRKNGIAVVLLIAIVAGILGGCGKTEVKAAKFGNIEYNLSRPENNTTKAETPKNLKDNKFLSGLNFINDETPVTIPEKVAKGDEKERKVGVPYTVNVQYDDGTGICVAIYDVVKDFDAVTDGTKDSTPAIQKALTAASKAGGGVVYMPEGIYLCENSIEIPAGVTLRGEWVSPETSPAGSCGTVILVKTASRGRESGSAFIKMKAGSGLRNVTILYPEQTAKEIEKYPATIQESGGDSFTVMNTTIAGAWNAYQGNLSWSELHYLKNVYITAFNNAIMLDNVTDIGRLEGVHISPKYFVENVMYPFTKNEQKIVRDYMFEYAVGLWMQRSDWEYVYDFYAEGIYCAIRQIYNKEQRAANAQFSNLEIKNCNIGIDIQATNAIGSVFTDVNITGDEKCQYGVLMNAGFSEKCGFQNLNITGKIKEQFASLGNGQITVTNSKFSGWDSNSYALNMHKGSISVQQTDFDGDKKHINIAASCGGTSVLGCTFSGKEDIKYDDTKKEFILVDHTPLDLPKTSGRMHVYRQSIPTAKSEYLYNVKDYGAQNGKDSTEGFKKAIEAAKKTGGIIYVPAGEYEITETLTIPSGVELRGIYNVPTHSVTAGSILITRLGKGSDTGEALINLEEGAGINGMSFYYPEQSYTDFIKYPYTVRSLGKNCWAVNSVFINSYQALDFGTNPSDGHYINYCSGAALSKGIFVGNNQSNGWVENCQFNPHYWKRAAVSGKPASGEDQLNAKINFTLDVFTFGDNASEHMLGNFAFGGANLLTFISQGKGGTNGTIIGHGSDGCRNALVVHEADVLEFLNAELVSMSFDKDMHHIIMKETVTGTVALYNSMMWAQPVSSAIDMRGGTLVIAQLNYHNMESTVNLIDAVGGTVYYSSVLLPLKTEQIKASSGAKLYLTANIAKQSLAFVAPSGGAKITIKNTGATIEEKATWWS